MASRSKMPRDLPPHKNICPTTMLGIGKNLETPASRKGSRSRYLIDLDRYLEYQYAQVNALEAKGEVMMFKKKISVLCGISACAFISSQGQAQAAPAASPVSSPDTATGTSPQQPNQEIVVTGLSRSLASSQMAKRRSPVIIEAITPEDIGKFTDNSIADQLQRLPGVQIDRNTDGRSGDAVTILGFGAEFVTTTINGRTPGSYGSEGIRDLRQFAVDILPSEILSGVSVYKSTSADQVESGLGGSVDFQTLRPLDYHAPGGKSVFGSLTGKVTNNDSTSSWGKGISGVFGGKFLNDTIGLVISGIANDNPNQIDFLEDRPNLDTVNVRNASGGIDRQSVLFPGLFDYGRRYANIKRQAVSADLEWRPSSNLDVNIDYTYSNYNRPENRNDDQIGPYDSGDILQGVFEPGGITITNGGVTGLNFAHYTPATATSVVPFGIQPVPLVYNNEATEQIGGLNVKYHDDKFFANVDLGLNHLSATQNLSLSLSPEVNYPSFSDVNYSANTSGPATLNAGAPQFNSASDFSAAGGTFQRFYLTKTKGGSAKLDFGYKMNDSLTFKAGARYFQANVDVRDISQFVPVTAAQAATVQSILYPGGQTNLFPGYNVGRNVVATENPGGLFAFNNGFVPALDLNGRLATGSFFGANQGENGFSLNPLDSHVNIEKTLAGYAQGDFNTSIFGMGLSGNVGVRLVQTWETAKAFQSINYVDPSTNLSTHVDSYEPITQKNSYLNALPQFNFTLHPNDDMNIRLGIGKSLTRPEYELISPINTLNVPDQTRPGYSSAVRGSGAIGNVGLKPETAWNYLTSVEYYTHGASYVVSGFYKSVSNFIAPVTVYNTTVPGQGSQLFNITQAENISSGKAYGFQVSVNQPFAPFSSLLKGFGLQASYVYTKTSIDQPIAGHKFSFPGASKNSVSTSLYYSKGRLDARLAMTYRSSYLSQLPVLGLVDFPVYTNGMTNLDGYVSYNLTSRLNITFSITNITKQQRRDFVYKSTNFLNFYSVPRTVAIAARVQL